VPAERVSAKRDAGYILPKKISRICKISECVSPGSPLNYYCLGTHGLRAGAEKSNALGKILNCASKHTNHSYVKANSFSSSKKVFFEQKPGLTINFGQSSLAFGLK